MQFDNSFLNQHVFAHKYKDGTLYYKVGTTEERSEWKSIEDCAKFASIIKDYWNSINIAKAETVQASIPEPKELLELRNVNGENCILCVFEDFDTPVYLPVSMLINMCESKVLSFYESLIPINNT